MMGIVSRSEEKISITHLTSTHASPSDLVARLLCEIYAGAYMSFLRTLMLKAKVSPSVLKQNTVAQNNNSQMDIKINQ
jgi:hypothetical protein